MSDFLAEMEARRNRVKTPGAPIASVIAGYIIAFIAILCALPFSIEAAMDMAAGEGPALAWMARSLGAALAITLVVGGVLWFAFVRRSRPRWILPVLAGLLVMTSIFGLGFSRFIGEAVEARRQEEIVLAELQNLLGVIAKGDVQSIKIDMRPKARGQAAELERVIKTAFAEVLAAAKTYDAEITKLELDKMANRPVSRAGLAEHRRRFVRSRELTQAYRTEILAVLDRIPKNIEAAKVDPGFKAGFLRGYNRSLDAAIGRLERQLDLAVKLIDLNIAQIDWLLARPGAWQAQGNQVAFYRQPDLDTFNRQIAEIEAVRSELVGLEREQRDKLQRYSTDGIDLR